jgi:lipopolysaccharide heptosyltransferase II
MNKLIAAQIRRAPEDWFWVHNRWKTPQPNFLLARYKRGVYLPPESTRENLKPFRILIRASNWLGYSVMSVPAVRAIKTGRPDAQVTIATPENLAPIWKLIPEVDEIIPLTSKSLLATIRLLRKQPRFDVAIVLPNSLRAALEVWLSGIPRRVGYRGHRRSWLLSQIVREPRKPGPPEHHADRYLRIAQECGAETSNAQADSAKAAKAATAGRSTLNVQFPSSNQPSTLNHLSRRSDAKADQPILGLCPGAEYGPAKRWLPEGFAEAAAAVSAQSRAQWILFGTKHDVAIGKTIATALSGNCVNRIGETTLEQLIDELRPCRLLLTNDTGTMHVAALLGVPVVAIFGSTEPQLTAPPGTNHIVLRHHVECSPCFLRECPIDFRCMKAITVSEVVDAVMSILVGSAPKNANMI